MNQFEKVSNEVSGENSFETSNECAIEWLRGDKVATVTFPKGTRYTSRIKKLAAENPEEVVIRYENKDGSIVATIPTSYIRLNAKRAKKELTEDQKQALRERFAKNSKK